MTDVVVVGADAAQWGALSWPAAALAVVTLLIRLMFRLCAECQRRVTLVALMNRASRGTIIVQERGQGRPAMAVLIGQDGERDRRDREP